MLFRSGFTNEPVIAVQEATTTESILRVLAPDHRPTVQLNGGEAPGLSFGLSGLPADKVTTGVVRSFGKLGRGNALLNIVAPGKRDTILAVRDQPEDAHPRLSIRADGRIQWNDGDSEPVSLAVSKGEISAQGTLSSTALRVGEGSLVRGIRLVAIDLVPEAVAKGATHTQTVSAKGVTPGSLVFASAPAQPSGIALSHAIADGPDRVSLTFVNVGGAAAKPAAGRYSLLVVEGHADAR